MNRTRTAVLTAALCAVFAQPALQTQGSSSQASRRIAVLAAEENRAETTEDLRVLVESATTTGGEEVRTAAVRALGRLERRDVMSYLLPLVRAGERSVREEAANALAQAFKGEPLSESPTVDQ